MMSLISLFVPFALLIAVPTSTVAAAAAAWPLRSFDVHGHYQAPYKIDVSNLHVDFHNFSAWTSPVPVGGAWMQAPLIGSNGLWYLLFTMSDKQDEENVTLTCYDPNTKTVVANFTGDPAFEMILLGNGSLVVIDALYPDALTVLDEHLAVINRIQFPPDLPPTFLWISADGTLLLVAVNGNSPPGPTAITAYNLTSEEFIWTTQPPEPNAQFYKGADAFTISEDGSRFYTMVWGYWKGVTGQMNIIALDVATGKVLWSESMNRKENDPCRGSSIVLTAASTAGCGDGLDGGLVTSICDNEDLTVRDGRTGRALWHFSYPDQDGTFMYFWDKLVVSCRNEVQAADLLIASFFYLPVQGPQLETVHTFSFDFATGKQIGSEMHESVVGMVVDANGTLFSVSHPFTYNFSTPTYFWGMDPVTGQATTKLELFPFGGLIIGDCPAVTPRGGYVNYAMMWDNYPVFFEVYSP